MKYFIFLFLWISAVGFANEIRSIQGQKVVMFSAKTALSVQKILADSSLSKVEKVGELKIVFRKETKYCSTVGKTFKPELEAKCTKLLFGNYFAEDLVAQGLDESELTQVQTTLSQYFTLLLLF